jgi:hypothetical protein
MTYTPIAAPGEKFYISATPTGAATLDVLGVDKISEYGPASKEIEVTTIRDTSRVYTAAPLDDYGTVTIEGNASNQDAGQQMLKTAQAAKTAYNFKHELNDAAKLGLTNNTYFSGSGMVLSYTQGAADKNGVRRFRAQIKPTGPWPETLAS